MGFFCIHSAKLQKMDKNTYIYNELFYLLSLFLYFCAKFITLFFYQDGQFRLDIGKEIA